MREYFFLWANPNQLNDAYRFQMNLMGTFDKSVAILETPRPFASYEAFLNSCNSTAGLND